MTLQASGTLLLVFGCFCMNSLESNPASKPSHQQVIWMKLGCGGHLILLAVERALACIHIIVSSDRINVFKT
ncbi:hypothetical protein MKW98_010101 [Papaver atlanticum]|uniref:Uncharacterized protein n=1 Tax=Papaver atlanticum TaxID=357466 RepID=A0AAD4RXF3_9MAGN|nr:hypothetical protein MKW98_010101 [Papaver atlanticum]